MTALTRPWWAFWSIVLAMPIVALMVLVWAPSLDFEWRQQSFHFYSVSATALLGGATCAMLAASARSMRESRLLFLALAFASIAAVFSVHGLTTPGFHYHGVYPALIISGWLSLLVGAVFITASVVRAPENLERWIQLHGVLIVACTSLALAGYILASLYVAESQWLAWIPYRSDWLRLGTAALVFGLLGFSCWRYFQAYLFARLPSQWAMVVALALLIGAQVGITWGRPYQLSWWMYHLLYGLAFIALFGGWALEAARAGSVKAIGEALAMRDALEQLNRGRADSLIDLADAIEAKDAATLGHVSRVAAYSLAAGRELGLHPWELRSLVLAAQMHDVGKIGTPDAILRKPGPLTDEEYSVIKEHASRGDAIAARTKGLRYLRRAIRHHHERYDGMGYPDGLKGDAIPHLSRIISVADTYDALTSGRSYRPAISLAAAIDELRSVSGTQLDPRCVEAFVTGMAKRDAIPQLERAA